MISKKTALKELAKREQLKQSRPIIDDIGFDKQNAFVNDTSRYIDAQCSRRAGKSNGLAKRFLKTMEKYPGKTCIYLAMTRDSAKSIMWPVMLELDEKYHVGLIPKESKLEFIHPNGSKLKLYGADMKNFIKRIKGQKSPGIGVDEAQDFGTHLQSLLDDVLTPMMADFVDPWLALVGTPGPVPQGYFYDVTYGNKYGFSHHAWTIFDNPFIPNPHVFLEDLKKKREWDENNPTLKREWLNQWVLDTQSLWIQYNETKCHYETIPNRIGSEWNFILGIDIGYKDADALAVLGWNTANSDTYLIEEIITKGQDITSLVEQITKLNDKYKFTRMIIDQGGLGLKAAEEIRRRHSIPVIGAEKQRKQETVAFLNDSLRRGAFKAQRTSRFAKDSYLIQIDWDKTTPDKIVVKKQPHSDIIDAVLYAFKESPAYTYQKPKEKPKVGTKAWGDAEAERLEALAEAHFERIENKEWYED